MKRIDHLWRERLKTYGQELRRYTKYIFNDHIKFVLIFAVGGGAFYYTQWLKTVDASFPATWIMAIILAIFMTISPIYTLLKKPDAVFLTPLETKLTSYFTKAFWLSFWFQAYVLLMVLVALMPLYAEVTGEGFRSFFYFFIMLLILKYWNISFYWNVLKLQGKNNLFGEQTLRFAMNVVFLFLLFEQASFWLLAIMGLIYAGVYFYFKKVVKNKTLNWERLIEKEEQRMLLFYRIANLFTTVPQLKGKVKRRKWLDPLFQFVPYKQQNTYVYLFSRTLIRTSEYFGLYLRLTLIATVVLYFSENIHVMIAISLLFIYLTSFQFVPMVRHHDLKIWPQLYPVPEKEKKRSFLSLLSKLLIAQSCLFGLIVFIKGMFIEGLVALIIVLAFSYFLVKWYIPRRLKRLEKSFLA